MSEHEVNAFPAKRFFVEMLTKDIELQDAILDLLDNCVDGALRSIGEVGEDPTPYRDYWAKINFDGSSFRLEDNCGGIPQDLAENYAFRMGRSDPDRDNNVATVGVYGIGMKRAMFKMGHQSQVKSKTSEGDFSVTIPREWMDDDSAWMLNLETGTSGLSNVGTTILVDSLREGVSRLLSNETGFEEELKRSISAYYGYIISKGFSVYVNDELIEPIRITFLTDNRALSERGEALAPYIYETSVDGVDVSVTVGLYTQIGANDEDDQGEDPVARPSSDKAGWSVVCNDRVVLYADKTRVTGWGDANVPQYHPQFVSIAGVVVFKTNDARKLPVTTTKRGIEGNSELYLGVKNYMRDGLKQFTDFTNRWKSPSPERAVAMRGATEALLAKDVSERVVAQKWTNVRGDLGGKVFKPSLPRPHETDPHRSIQFSRRESEIEQVRRFLFDEIAASNSLIGSKCFEEILERSRK